MNNILRSAPFALAASLAVLLAGCSGSVPANPPSDAAQPQASRAGWLSPAARAKNAPLLYVSSLTGNAVDIFPEYGKNAPPIGEITNGINQPAGVAVDRRGNLYVANEGNSTVTVYPRGSTSPSGTYSTGLQDPFVVAVWNDGTLYVSCAQSQVAGFVAEYPPGSMSPSRTISMPNVGPWGIALDASNNLYIVFQNHDAFRGLYKYAPGTGSLGGTNLGITMPQPGYPTGIAFDRAGNLVLVVSGAPSSPSAVYVYPPWSKTFSRSITARRMFDPGPIAFDQRGERLFLSDWGYRVVHEYRYSDGKALTPEKRGVVASAPNGVAVDPPERL
jgi:sugar lactone lactonase YvrE